MKSWRLASPGLAELSSASGDCEAWPSNCSGPRMWESVTKWIRRARCSHRWLLSRSMRGSDVCVRCGLRRGAEG